MLKVLRKLKGEQKHGLIGEIGIELAQETLK